MRHRKGIEPDEREYVVRLGEVKVGKLKLGIHYMRKKTSIFNKKEKYFVLQLSDTSDSCSWAYKQLFISLYTFIYTF